MKYPNMECFIGSGFDVESSWIFMEGRWLIHQTENYIKNLLDGNEEFKLRPRLNKPQVLDDWSWAERLEGFVWQIWYVDPPLICTQSITTSNFDDFLSLVPEFASFIGVEKGSGLEEWARSVDVPILEVS